MSFSSRAPEIPSQMYSDPNASKYQESRMLFFGKKEDEKRKVDATRPKTIGEIKKLQNFVKTKQTTPGQSLNESIKGMARRDPSFNEFLRNFRAKNEHKWASIVDMTRQDQEDQLLARSPEYRKNEMIMLEELKRRKRQKDYYNLRLKEDD